MAASANLIYVKIKAATAEDAGKLLKMMRAYYRFDRMPFDRKTIASGLSELLNDHALGRAWLILKGHRPVGYLLFTFGFDLEFGGRQATITDLYIDPHHRSRGIGRKVLMEVEAFGRSCGVKALELQVTSKNALALAFYQRVGFVAHERIPMSKRIGAEPKTAAHVRESSRTCPSETAA